MNKNQKQTNRPGAARTAGESTTMGATTGTLGGEPVQGGYTMASLQRYLDYSVVDRNDDKIGSVDAVWEDGTGQPAYIGVKTGWLGLGRAHVVPVQAAHVSDSTRKIRLPYSTEVVKNAPAFDAENEIDSDAETRISEYYTNHGFNAAAWSTSRSDYAAGHEDIGRRESSAHTTSEEEVRMPLSSEEVNVGKRQVEAGGVRLRKVIRTETVNKPVELQREEIVVERVPASERTPSRTDVAFREEEVFVPLRREEPVVEKTTRTREEVRVGKKRDTERRDIKETVRREDVDIQKEGEAKKPGWTDQPRR